MFEENKTIARRLMDEAWSEGKLDVISEIVASDCHLHDPVFPSLTPGAESLKRHIQMCRTSFPDLRFRIDDVIAERNEVVIHWIAGGTHKAQFLGMQPTNRKANVSGTSIYRLHNGKIVEMWSDWNVLTLMQQLGLTVTPKVAEAQRSEAHRS